MSMRRDGISVSLRGAIQSCKSMFGVGTGHFKVLQQHVVRPRGCEVQHMYCPPVGEAFQNILNSYSSTTHPFRSRERQFRILEDQHREE